MDSGPTRRRHTATFETQSSGLSGNLLLRLEALCGGLHLAILRILRRGRIRGFSVRVILTSDLEAEVNRLRALSDDGDLRVFTRERLGGRVQGKSFRPQSDGEPYTLVLSDEDWEDDNDDALSRALAVVAHELGHCAIGNCRRASGFIPPAPATDVTLGESVAREIVSTAVDEFRADRIEDLLLSAMGHVSVAKETVPLRLHHLYGSAYTESLCEVLSDVVYPGWPDRVQEYRDWQVTLEDMWEGIARSAWETFTLIAHTAAAARSAGDPDPLTAGELSENPAVVLYVGEPWRRLLDAGNSVSAFCTPRALAKMEARAYAEGVDALLAMWGELGLTFTLRQSGAQHIAVTAPARLPGE